MSSLDKAALRGVAASRRAALAAAQASAGDGLRDSFLASIDLPDGTALSGYWPLPEEMDIRPLLTELHRRGHPIGLPIIAGKGRPLLFRRWTPDEPLVMGPFGVSCPGDTCEEIRPDIVLVPMLAFDTTGYRLGYGGGYYDRTLAKLRKDGKTVLAVGVAFAGQEVPRVPTETHDQKLDWIVTEAGATRIG